MRKLLQNAALEQKKFRSLRENFFTNQFLASQKQRYEQKPLSFRSALHFCSAPKSNLFTRFISRFKNHSKKFIKHSRTSPDVQFKEFSLTKKTRPKTDYEWIGKTILQKNPIQKTKKQ